jgi:hypothetical protein
VLDLEEVAELVEVVHPSGVGAVSAKERLGVGPATRVTGSIWGDGLAATRDGVPLAVVFDSVESAAPGPFSLSDPNRAESLLVESGLDEITIDSRTSMIDIGSDMDDTVDFLFDLMPPAGALRQNDPDKAAEVRSALAVELSGWAGPEGVRAPSAVWIVTATKPN